MTVYQTIVKEKIMSESVMALLLGDTNEQDRKRLLLSNNLALISRKVCMLYEALIQIYVVARAVNSFGEYLMQINEPAVKNIKQYWNVDDKQDIANKNSVFSFLSVWANAGIDEILPQEANSAIRDIINACEKLDGNNRYEDPFIEEKFLALVRSMPLLSCFEFDYERYKVLFNNDEISYVTEYSPFIEFWDSERKRSTKRKTDYPMVLTSVDKGNVNGELDFNYAYLDKYYRKSNTEIIRKPVADDEWLRMICQCFDVKTEWYPVEQCWGNNAFLKHVNDVVYDVFINRWKCATSKAAKTAIQKQLKEAFNGSDMYDSIGGNVILRKELSNYLYGLFIKFGVFKTIKCIFIESSSTDDNKDIYEDFISCIENKELSSHEQIEQAKKECDNTISFHKNKLKKFLASDTPAYEKRLREIKAEWRAFTILKLCGMRTEKIFADIENIFSIDDYFEMIKNPATSLYEDLEEVMLLLTVFYGALEKDYMSVDGKWKYDELRFQKYALALRKKLAGAGVEALFDEFVDIVKRTSDKPVISDTLGRNDICDLNKLVEYRDEIFNDLKQTENEKRNVKYDSPEKWAFISYKHNADGSTPKYIEAIKQGNINCELDENELQGGENWKSWVFKSIHNKNCEAVYVFLDKNAVVSDAVKYELMEAVTEAKERKEKNPDFDADRFIVPINLEKEELATYIYKLAKTENGDTARAIRDFLTPKSGMLSDKYFLAWPEDSEQILKDMRKRAPAADETGYVVRMNYTDSERHIANFYAFLKYGSEYYDIDDDDELNDRFKSLSTSYCVYPMVLSVKEKKIKRDNITLVGYEIISGSKATPLENCYILTSEKLTTDEYYCIPNSRTANDYSWMIEPFLVREDLFFGKE